MGEDEAAFRRSHLRELGAALQEQNVVHSILPADNQKVFLNVSHNSRSSQAHVLCLLRASDGTCTSASAGSHRRLMNAERSRSKCTTWKVTTTLRGSLGVKLSQPVFTSGCLGSNHIARHRLYPFKLRGRRSEIIGATECQLFSLDSRRHVTDTAIVE